MKKFASTLNIGAIRTSNQDQVCISHLKGLDLMLVCDGMGGANAGDVASKLCKDYIEQAFIKKPSFYCDAAFFDSYCVIKSTLG